MNEHTPTLSSSSRRAAMPRQVAWLGLAVLVATSTLTILRASHPNEIPIVMVGIVVVLTGVYGFVLPGKLARPGGGGTALALSVIAAVLLLPAFWSGQSLILGAAGALLGSHGRQAPQRARATAAVVIGLVASLGYFAIYVYDIVAPAGG